MISDGKAFIKLAQFSSKLHDLKFSWHDFEVSRAN
jgi:hypothetical protein